MASIDNALTTLSRAKSFLGISGASKDFVLTMLILGVTQFIQDTYCRRQFKRQTFTQELYNGKGAKRLWLKNKPIISGQTLTLEYRNSSVNEDNWQTIDTSAYFVNYKGGALEFQAGYVDAFLGLLNCFIEGTQNYRVTYTAGFYLPSSANYQDGTDDDLDLPYDLELAALDLIAAVYNNRQAAGIQSQQVNDVSITYAKELEKHPTVKATLDKYRANAYA